MQAQGSAMIDCSLPGFDDHEIILVFSAYYTMEQAASLEI